MIILAAISLMAYWLAPGVIEKFPALGYAMTVPLRIYWVWACATSYDGVHGILLGCGMAMLMSFERSWFWAIGIAMLGLSLALWPHV